VDGNNNINKKLYSKRVKQLVQTNLLLNLHDKVDR